RAKDTSSTTVAGSVLAMGTVPDSVDEHTIPIWEVWTLAFFSGGASTVQCLHLGSIPSPRCSRGPELVLCLIITFFFPKILTNRICNIISYNSSSLGEHQHETKSDPIEMFWEEQTELKRIRVLQLKGAGEMLKLGNDHLTKSAVVSQELQLGILSHKVRAMSNKGEESEP
ncbi:14290_t:CDS:2, partial [Acaulospora morrowiae]